MIHGSRFFRHTLISLGFFAVSANAYDFSAVEKLIDDSIAVFRDSVLVLVEQDGATILATTRGAFDSTRRIRIASASKWLSGAVILACVERGYFALDDSLGTLLPQFTQAGKGAITIRQCFSMASGLYGGNKYEAEALWTFARTVDSIAAFTPLAYAPGTAWAYDGKGMQAAGRFAELASGSSWRQLARDLVLDPCGMDSTDYDYYLWNPWPAGGVKTTPADYLRFLRMVINNGMRGTTRVLTTASIDAMFSAPNQDAPLFAGAEPVFPVNQPSYQYGMDTVRYGFSSWVLTYNPATHVVEEITSPGYWGTVPWADRCRNTIGVIFMDGGLLGPLAYPTEIALIGLIRDQIGGGCESAAVDDRDALAHHQPIRGKKLKIIAGTQIVIAADRTSVVDLFGRKTSPAVPIPARPMHSNRSRDRIFQ